MRLTYIVGILIAVTYGQLIIKYETNKLGPISMDSIQNIFSYLLKAISNIGIISGLLAAAVSALLWIMAMSKYELSSLYPFLSINFILVPLLSVYFFNESINLQKVIGVGIICIGVFVFSRAS